MGWNKTLPASGEAVTGAMTFVAKYQVLTNGREYSINYVNQDNVQIATTKVMTAPLGSTVNERAKTIAGYELIGAADLSITIGETDNSITYVYRDLNVTQEYVESVVVIPVGLPANTAVSTATGGAGTGGTTTNQGDDTENVTDSETPLSPGDGTEEVPDDQTPLKKGEEGINYTYLYITGGIVLLLIAAGIFILKRKQASE